MADDDCRTDRRATEIYALCEPDTGEVRYIGKTACGISRRLCEHISNSKRRLYNGHFFNWLNVLVAKGQKPKTLILETVLAGGDWAASERKWISHYREMGARLTNATEGGEGVTGRKWVPNAESRARMAAAQLGRKASLETRVKRSESLRKFYLDPEQMRKRKELGAKAGLSEGSRKAAKQRMKEVWADPVKRADWVFRLRGVKKRNAGKRNSRRLLPRSRETQGAFDF